MRGDHPRPARNSHTQAPELSYRLDDYVDEKQEAVTSKVKGATETVASVASQVEC